MKVRVREIFASIQGEGPYIGYKQLFIRLCSCNLHCKYCDTEFDIQNSKEYSKEELLRIVNENLDCHSVSFTGGEPLLSIDFLKDFIYPNKPLIYEEYKIFFIPYKDESISLDVEENYNISGNNVDGFILTIKGEK